MQALAILRGNGRRGIPAYTGRLLATKCTCGRHELFWPQPLQSFYFFYRYLGNALQTFIPVDCLYSDAFYIATITAALAPLVMTLTFATCWGIVWVVFKAIGSSVQMLRSLLVNITVIGLAYVHPFLV